MNDTQEMNKRVINVATLNIGDQVNVTVKSIDEMGLLVTMDAYNDEEAFVPLSEAYKRTKVNGVKVAKPRKKVVGDQCMATIIRIDKERGYVDLKF